MSAAEAAWQSFDRALSRLDAALGYVDADAILESAAEVHAAATLLATPGLVQDAARLSDALEGALKRIESCRLRVLFLADHGARRVSLLTGGVALPTGATARQA